MAVKGTIMVRIDFALSLWWWEIRLEHSVGSLKYDKPYKSYRSAVTSAKRQAKRLGIDVSEQ